MKEPDHPPIFVYNLGLPWLFVQELENMDGVSVLPLPRFTPHWRACYTWKTYILSHPLADQNVYLDAGVQVLEPLTELFELIERDGYFFVDQGHDVTLADVTPSDFIQKYGVNASMLNTKIITAGIVGFSRSPLVGRIMDELYQAGKDGDCLGFSRRDWWRSRGPNRTHVVRDCKAFRHDTTILSLLVRTRMPQAHVQDLSLFEGHITGRKQYICNIRLNYVTLPYLFRPCRQRHSFFGRAVYVCNRIWILGFVCLKNMRHIFSYIRYGIPKN